jgi:hypothetical protein
MMQSMMEMNTGAESDDEDEDAPQQKSVPDKGVRVNGGKSKVAKEVE